MRTLSAVVALLLGLCMVRGQGTLLFDQQSSDETHILEGSGAYSARLIQSFTPSFDSIGFVRFYLMAADLREGAVNLRADSPTGRILGTTLPVNVSSYNGPVTFVFGAPISLSPGTTYYLQPVAALSFGLINASQFYNYQGGMIFSPEGTPSPAWDLWFQEGILVPEPSGGALLLLGALVCLVRRKP